MSALPYLLRGLLASGLGLFITPAFLNAAKNDQVVSQNPFLSERMGHLIAPYLLPSDHPMKARLDSIFSQTGVLENERTFADAGFSIIAGPMPFSFVVVARHSEIPGYVFKLYLDSDSRRRKKIPHWMWLLRRCVGARGIKKIIEQKKIRHFSVPDKWLYLLPALPFSSHPQPVILMETDMQPESRQVNRQKWKTVVTREHLDELYSILKEGHGGHGTGFLDNNVPFTRSGKFAFTDTEDPQAKLKLQHIKTYLSHEMAEYWDTLINRK